MLQQHASNRFRYTSFMLRPALPSWKAPPSLCAPWIVLSLVSIFLRPGKYAGVPRHQCDDMFRLQDVGEWIGTRILDVLTCPVPDLLSTKQSARGDHWPLLVWPPFPLSCPLLGCLCPIPPRAPGGTDYHPQRVRCRTRRGCVGQPPPVPHHLGLVPIGPILPRPGLRGRRRLRSLHSRRRSHGPLMCGDRRQPHSPHWSLEIR